MLGRVGMPVKYAENGREGIEMLERNPDVELVLMDIMMPEMDGYETIGAIRRSPLWTDLPIIALTAKAMPGDREKAIAQRRERLRPQAGGRRPSADRRLRPAGPGGRRDEPDPDGAASGAVPASTGTSQTRRSGSRAVPPTIT